MYAIGSHFLDLFDDVVRSCVRRLDFFFVLRFLSELFWEPSEMHERLNRWLLPFVPCIVFRSNAFASCLLVSFSCCAAPAALFFADLFSSLLRRARSSAAFFPSSAARYSSLLRRACSSALESLLSCCRSCFASNRSTFPSRNNEFWHELQIAKERTIDEAVPFKHFLMISRR